MAEPNPVELNETPILELDYDHDDLVALLHDLSALVEQASVDRTRVRALKQARNLMRYFTQDMKSHFELEENDLFPVLRQELPQKQEAVDSLARAHENFTDLIGTLRTTICDDDVTKERLKECRESLTKLIHRFETHSRAECELARALDRAVTDPERRRVLRERLSGL